MSTFPSVVTTYTDPLATQNLNAPSHSGIESAQNSGLRQLEAVIGVEGSSSVVGTLEYFIKSAGSSGGGHVQAANVGGTGQTGYNKGDLLVASSSSVLAKLSVGTDTQALLADSTQAAGIKWGGVAVAANIQNQTYTYVRASVMSASVYGITPSNVVSMLIDGQSFAIKWPTTNTTSLLALTVGATGPSSVTALLKNRDGTNPIVGAVQASAIGIVEFESVSSVFQLQSDYIPTYGASVTTFLRNDATWASIATLSTIKGGAVIGSITGAANLQAVAHGLGKVPVFTKIKAVANDATTAYWESDGTYDGTNTNTLYQPNAGNAGAVTIGAPAVDTTNVIHILTGTNKNSILGVLTTDATNLNITWSINPGTAIGTGSLGLKWESYA
jgi:hypothetical protein